MKEFRVIVSNRPGELARVVNALARQGVSLKAVAATAHSNQVTVHLVGHDVESTRSGLQTAGIPFEEHEAITVLLEDKAGELAKVLGTLADAGVNLNAIYLAGRADDLVEIVLVADDTKKAKKILGDSTI